MDSLARNVDVETVGRVDFSQIGPPSEFDFHETACVEAPATIGPGTRIGPYAHIRAGAVVGKDCQIGRNVVIAPTAVLADGVIIGPNVVVADGVQLESGVVCRQGVVFAIQRKPRSEETGLPPSVASPGTVPVFSESQEKLILIREGVTLGANATILGGVTIEAYATIGAGAVVTRDVLRHAVMTGVPARQTGWLCRCGEKIFPSREMTVSMCSACGRQYRKEPSGAVEFSLDEERKRQKADHHRQERKYFESIS